MARHAGISILLSVLVVAFFAVALYQPDHPPTTPSHVAANPSVARSEPSRDDLRPEPTPGTPLIETVPAGAARRASPNVVSSAAPRRSQRAARDSSGGMARSARSLRGTRLASRGNPASMARSFSGEPSAIRPSTAFTQTAEGETLADVALRVYGTTDAARTLWSANRDIVRSRQETLAAGTLLRTP